MSAVVVDVSNVTTARVPTAEAKAAAQPSEARRVRSQT
jgi:hypothetical protein